MTKKLLLSILIILTTTTLYGQVSEDSDETIYKIVEQMPIFPVSNCGEEEPLVMCAQKDMLKFIYGNIQYPEKARKKKKQGMVVISFIVEKDGSVSNVQLARGIGLGCDEEALRVVNLMKDLDPWTPGRQEGRTVRVTYNLPIKFKL